MSSVSVRDAYDPSIIIQVFFDSSSSSSSPSSLSSSPSLSVAVIKVSISLQHPLNPPPWAQRLIFNGRILSDSESVPYQSSLVLAIRNVRSNAPSSTSASVSSAPSSSSSSSYSLPSSASFASSPSLAFASSPSSTASSSPPASLASLSSLHVSPLSCSSVSDSAKSPHISATSAPIPESSPSPFRPFVSRFSLSTPIPFAARAPPQNSPVNPSSSAAAPANSTSPPAVVAPLTPPSRFAAVWRLFDLRLLLKLGMLLLVLGRQGDTLRSTALVVAAIVAYLWQVGAFRGRENGEAAANDEAAAVAGIREARRQARAAAAEAAAAAAGNEAQNENGGGLAGLFGQLEEANEEDDFEDDLVAQREQLAQMAAQHRAEMIRRGTAHESHPMPAINNLQAAEKFVVGLFASLLPSWRVRDYHAE